MAPIGFLVTWQMIDLLGLQHLLDAGAARLPFALDVLGVVAATSPRYSTAFLGVPMSTNAASMPGSTFWTRPR